jgi:hypothetical protein
LATRRRSASLSGIPVAHIEDHREAVGQRRIERFCAEILFAEDWSVVHGVHRRPAVAQLGERRPWIFRSWHQREEAVLVLGLAAADLVDEHRLRAPDRGRRLEEPDRRLGLVRVGEAHKVVERDQAGVVVAMLEAQRLADGLSRNVLPVPLRPMSRIGSPLASAARMTGSCASKP